MGKIILKKFTILYVEDELETQEFISDILKKYFKEVYIGSNGKEGLELFKQKNPNIVLSDIMMPVCNGIEMCKQIKKLNPHQSIAIFTAFDEHDYLTQAVNMGLDKYISKPFDAQHFFRALINIAKVLQSDIDKANANQLLEVQSKVASMSEMLGNISHQWRQPLSIISTSASGIIVSKEFNYISETTEKEMLKKIVQQADMLSKMIEDIGDFFKETSHKSDELDIKSIINKVIDLTDDIYKQNHIQIVSNIQSCIISQNQNHIVQAFLNIFHNTKDAFILNAIDSKRYFFIDVKIKNNNLIITFKDNAGGIPEDIIDKVFEPFFTTKHQYYGTGVGLYMTHKIINKHLNGIINVKNAQYKYDEQSYLGASFCVELQIK